MLKTVARRLGKARLLGPPAAMSKVITLILLPGLDGTEIFFQPLLGALPESVRPVVVQYPRAGGNRYDELLAVIRRATSGIPEYYVLGWSFSGPLALMLAVAEPERVRGVILSATFVRPPHAWLWWIRFALVGPVVWSWRVLRRLPLWLFRSRDDPERRAKTQTWRRIPASLLARRLRTIADVDARAALRTCRAPVLQLAASHDAIVPRHNVDDILSECPSAQVVTIEGRHLAMYANPLPAVEAIVRFMARTGR
jgi:pimeloyl-[acyl-carrier protein] methyl ester esterase